MVTLYHSKLDGFVIKRSYYHAINMGVINPRDIDNDVNADDIKNFVDIEQLNKLINEKISRKVKLSKLIEEEEIGGTVYDGKDGETKILHLDCDSDTYRTTIVVFVNLNTGETFVSDM